MTDAEIVLSANELAREFYRLMGYVAPEGYRFDRAARGREQLCWRMAAAAYEHIEATDIDDAVANTEGDA